MWVDRLDMILVVQLLLAVLAIHCVISQPLTVSPGTCPGDRIMFTCEEGDNAIIWDIAGQTSTCQYVLGVMSPPPCGPGGQFLPSGTERSNMNNLFFLSVVVTNELNGTQVTCITMGSPIGSINISVTESVVETTQFLRGDMIRAGGGEGGIVRVEWSEVMDNVGSPVSQYVLCVTPPTTSNDQSGSCNISTGCCNTSTTHYDLTAISNTNYNLTVRGVACDGIVYGTNSEPVNLQIIDGTRSNSASLNYNDITGVLESISVAHGGFSLEFMGEVTKYDVVMSLSPVYLSKTADIDDRVTSELNVTIRVPTDVIAEYRPTLTVNVPGAPTISLSSYPIASEVNETDLGREVVSVDISGSCSSIVTCLEGDNCTVYCGSSADLDSLNMRNESTSVSNDGDIDVRLPPTFDKEFHCIVSGSNSDGSLLFRVRTLDFKTGCPVEELLSTDKVPVCVEDGDCDCKLNSTDRRYGMMFNSTLVGSIAKLFTSSDYCYAAQTVPIRTCNTNKQWIGDFDVQLIVPAGVESTPKLVVTTLMTIGAVCFVIGVFSAVTVVVSVVKTPPSCIPIWYWVLFGASSVVTVAAIVMWIVVAVYITPRGGVDDESGIRRNPVTSLCEDVTNDGTRVTPVIICFILSVFLFILWFICLILNLLRIGLKSSDPKDQERQKESLLQSILKSCCKKRRQERLETTNIPQPYEESVVKTSSSSAPPTNYEEVREIDRTQDIQLASNEAYGPVQRSNIQTSPNMAYGQVNL